MQLILPARGSYAARPTSGLVRMNGESPQARTLSAWYPSFPQTTTFLHDAARGNNAMVADVTTTLPIYQGLDQFGSMLLFQGGTSDWEYLDSTFTGVSAANATIACWVYIPDNSRQGVFVKVGGSTSGFGIGIGNTQVNNSGNNIVGLYENVRYIATSTAYGTGVHHVAMVLNNSGFPEIYLDGRSIYSDSTGAPNATTAGLFISYNGTNGRTPTGCGLIDARVYNRPLSAAEVRRLYAPETRWELYWQPSTRKLFSAAASVSVALTGTITTATEADIVAGGKTIILTVTGDTWVAAGGTFDAQRQNIINGLDSAQAEANGWDAVVKATAAVTDVVRTSNTVVTITLEAFATYNITVNETITATVPGTALTLGGAVVASPTFTITAISATGDQSAHWLPMGMGPSMFRAGRAA